MLTFFLQVEEYSPDNPEEVFTAVAKLLAQTSPDGFAAFLSKENIVLHYEELVEFLHTRGLLHFQVSMLAQCAKRFRLTVSVHILKSYQRFTLKFI